MNEIEPQQHRPVGVGMPPDEPADYLHLVRMSRIVAVMIRLLRRAPRALCGEVLWGDPDRPGARPYPHSPLCPACVEIDGRAADIIAANIEYVPGYMI